MKTVCSVLLWLGISQVGLLAQNDALQTRVHQLLAELQKPAPAGPALLPPESQLASLQRSGERLRIQFYLPPSFLDREYNEDTHEELVEYFAAGLADFPYRQLQLEAQNPAGEFQALSQFLPQFEWEPQALADNQDPAPYDRGAYQLKTPKLHNSAQPTGFLDDKTVWLSAGHGWKYDRRHQTFKTQRHNTHGLVEDFSNVETVNYHLLDYLHRAGARVWTVRERDMNEREIIVDNDQGTPHYRETGNWSTSKTAGYRQQTYRYSISKRKQRASAEFCPTIPEAGWYWVSVHYVSGANRSVDTRYRIDHAGGSSMVSINQEVHGQTWVYLGQFYFEAGRAGKVVLLNESAETGQAIIADAVRFGGGMGSIGDCQHGRTSGEPRFEEGAQYYASYQGFPHCLGDVSVRPQYAEWELAKGTATERRNAIYLSWHSNASSYGGSGSETYIHSRRPVKGSRALRNFIHRELIGDIQRAWDGNWRDRGTKSADFGELRGLQTMPGVLLEVAFHDHPQDAEALSSPAFRDLAARAVYKGIVRYFAARDGQSPVFLPERPTHLRALNRTDQRVVLQWQAPPAGGIYGHAATAYRVYYGRHPKAFAESVRTREPAFTFEDLLPNTTYYFRIVALNAGGASAPSAVVALRTPSGQRDQPRYLIVDGYDRLDKGLALRVREHRPHYAPLGLTRRLRLERMNSYDYVGAHAAALAQNGVYFDGASNEVLAAGQLRLAPYDGVNWYLGRESVRDEVLSREERAVLRRYLDAGGNLIISGSELAYALDHKGQGASFYRDYFKSAYRGDDAGQSSVVGLGVFKQLEGELGGDQYRGYPPRSPDYLRVLQGGAPLLHYGDRKVAAVGYRGTYGIVNFAFPLETIGDPQLRAALLGRALDYLSTDSTTPTLLLAGLPDVFGTEIQLDLRRAPEGRAHFELRDPAGERVFWRAWNHAGGAKKVFSTADLPPALYEYHFEFMGLEQRGFVLKE
ncbi:MAG: N-acetylmuramoyl-L-alanine amidase [Bacteroidota bacterium]